MRLLGSEDVWVYLLPFEQMGWLGINLTNHMCPSGWLFTSRGDWELTWLITCAHQGDFLQAGRSDLPQVPSRNDRIRRSTASHYPTPKLLLRNAVWRERERAALWRVVSCKLASQHRLRWLDKVNRSGSNLKMVMSQFQNASNFNSKQANRVQRFCKFQRCAPAN